MKKKGLNLIATIITALFTVLSFVGLAFNFIVRAVSYGGRVENTNLTRGDWLECLKLKQTQADIFFLKENANLGLWNFARVLMIITFVVLVLVAVLAVVQLFYENKILALITKILSIAGIVLSVVFFVVLLVGGIVLSTSVNGISTSHLPSLGPIWIMVCGVVASVFGLLSARKAKK